MDIIMDLSINDILSELHFMYITSGIIMPVFIGLGLIGNVIILVILCGRAMRCAPVCLLQALAIHDILNMIYAIYSDVHPAVTAYHKGTSFVKALEIAKNNHDDVFGNFNFTAFYYVLRMLEMKSNRSCGPCLKFNKEYESKNHLEGTDIENKLTESTTERQIRSLTNDERANFIRKAIERFVGYNIIYIGLLFVLCLTAERCIAVLFPMKVGNCLTIKRTRILIAVSVCICLVVHIPQLIKEIVLVNENPDQLSNSENGLILSFRSIYERFFVISSLIMCILTLVLNFVLLWKIRSYRKSLQLSKHTKRVERNEVNVSVLIIVLIFFQLPHYIFVIIISFITKEIYFADFTAITRTAVIIRLIYIIQSSLNFVIYCLFAKRFRDIMHEQFTKLFIKLCGETKHDNIELKSVSSEKKNMKSFGNFLEIKLDVGGERLSFV